MTKKSSTGISFRPTVKSQNAIDTVMKENYLNKSGAINLILEEHGRTGGGNTNPYYRGLLAKFTTDMETAINEALISKDPSAIYNVMEELKCQIL